METLRRSKWPRNCCHSSSVGWRYSSVGRSARRRVMNAMWAVIAAALLAAFRRRLRLRPMIWRLIHTAIAMVIVAGSIIHAMLIEGTMETLSKAVLCALVLAAAIKVMVHLRPWTVVTRRKIKGRTAVD